MERSFNYVSLLLRLFAALIAHVFAYRSPLFISDAVQLAQAAIQSVLLLTAFLSNRSEDNHRVTVHIHIQQDVKFLHLRFCCGFITFLGPIGLHENTYSFHHHVDTLSDIALEWDDNRRQTDLTVRTN